MKRVVRKYLKWLLLAAACVITACTKASETEVSLENIRSASVKIVVGERYGSGIIVDNNGEELTIATVWHLLEGYDQGIVSFIDGKTGFGDVVKVKADKDLCFLSMKTSDLGSDVLEDIKVAKIDEEFFEKIEPEAEVTLVGAAVSPGAVMTQGTLKAKDYYVPEFEIYMLYLYCDAFEGMSGAGCFSKDGHLIGLLAGGSEASEAVCISLKDIIDVMKEGW